jgi:hypothetical protein
MTRLKLGKTMRVIPMREEDREPILQGVCKDCGNDTLNNELNPAFGEHGDESLYCLRCGSTHLDLL